MNDDNAGIPIPRTGRGMRERAPSFFVFWFFVDLVAACLSPAARTDPADE